MILRNRVKNYQLWGGMGGLCLAVSLLLSRFAPELASVDFLEGMLIGLSLVFNLTFLIRWRKERSA